MMDNVMVRYAVIGTENSTGRCGFIWIDRGAPGYSFSNEPCAYSTLHPDTDNALQYDVWGCKHIVEDVKQYSPTKFSNLKIVKLETTYDLNNMRISTKMFEVMDNGEMLELGKEVE